MLITTQPTTEARDYYKINAISNSILRYLDPSQGGYPELFLSAFKGELETEESKSLEEGRVFHAAMENFDNIIFYKGQPIVGQLKTYVEALANGHTEEEAYILTESKRSKLPYFQKQLNDNVEGCQDYLQFLQSCKGKIVVNETEAEVLKKRVFATVNNLIYQTYINPNHTNSIQCDSAFRQNEIEFYVHNFISFIEDNQVITQAFKGKLDHFGIYKVKTGYKVVIIDFKATRDSAIKFKYSINSWRYDRQLYLYKRLALHLIQAGYFDTVMPGISTIPRQLIDFELYLLPVDCYFNCITYKLSPTNLDLMSSDLAATDIRTEFENLFKQAALFANKPELVTNSPTVVEFTY